MPVGSMVAVFTIRIVWRLRQRVEGGAPNLLWKVIGEAYEPHEIDERAQWIRSGP